MWPARPSMNYRLNEIHSCNRSTSVYVFIGGSELCFKGEYFGGLLFLEANIN